VEVPHDVVVAFGGIDEQHRIEVRADTDADAEESDAGGGSNSNSNPNTGSTLAPRWKGDDDAQTQQTPRAGVVRLPSPASSSPGAALSPASSSVAVYDEDKGEGELDEEEGEVVVAVRSSSSSPQLRLVRWVGVQRNAFAFLLYVRIPSNAVAAPWCGLRWRRRGECVRRARRPATRGTQVIKERIYREALTDVALTVLPGPTSDSLEVRGRGVLHLGILCWF
jgi:hypothetical protein